MFIEKNTTQKTSPDKGDQRQVRPRELSNTGLLSEYPSEYFKSALASKDGWQVPKWRAARYKTALNLQPEIETDNRFSSLASIRECNSVDNPWGLSEIAKGYSISTARDKEGKRQQEPRLIERCNPFENHTEENHEGPPETNGYAAEAPQSSNYHTSPNNTTQR